ncbi:MFS transporter [Picrophilus oshimae]|uniref:Predicted arabinose efflux permease, MFS family n=1 Tax=Picrophilus torridus (strain ATCC 700027 / DSM 9790 / JCM 10055 / NBRC 100828 / KAW 2/3) TaxID=1122961 RepID=A0A8G2FW17_PICTO|nr:MFS transporter [Picrophilus oshimae]SMD30499.1 Predicted arabinose efflux permease, MFS family [Picrophilus oshimae DSM 9789]
MENNVENIIARANRIPVWSLPYSFLAIIGVGYFFTFYDISDIGLAMPAIDAQFHLGSSTSLFLALSVGLIGYGIGSYLIGSTADVIGRYKSMIITMALTALGSFGDAISLNVPELTIFRFITGLGLGADLNLVSTYISEFAPPGVRGKITVYTFLVGILGQAVTPFIGLELVPVYYDGWRWLFGIGAIIAFIALILRFELPESPRWLALKKKDIKKAEKILEMMERTAERKIGKLPEPDVTRVDTESGKFPTLYLFKRPYSTRLSLLVIVWFFWYIGNYAFLGDSASLLSSAGFSISSSILYLAIGAIGYPVGAIIMIATADKFERKYVIFIDTVVWFIGLTLFALKMDITLFIGSFLASMALGMYLQVAYTFTAENYPTRARSSGFALTDGLGHIGGAFGAIFLPVLVASYSFSFGFEFIAVTGLIAGILVLIGGTRATGKPLENISA